MTDQTEFAPEIKAEAERLLHRANFSLNAGKCFYIPDSIGVLALCRLLVATGWKPDVDPIEAKAREIVAGDCDPETVDDVMDGHASYALCHLVKLGILAGMEMGK